MPEYYIECMMYVVSRCYYGFANPKQLSKITEQDHLWLLDTPGQRALMTTVMATAEGLLTPPSPVTLCCAQRLRRKHKKKPSAYWNVLVAPLQLGAVKLVFLTCSPLQTSAISS